LTERLHRPEGPLGGRHAATVRPGRPAHPRGPGGSSRLRRRRRLTVSSCLMVHHRDTEKLERPWAATQSIMAERNERTRNKGRTRNPHTTCSLLSFLSPFFVSFGYLFLWPLLRRREMLVNKTRCRVFAAQKGQPLNPLRQAFPSVDSMPPGRTISPSCIL